jgi:hypothetical protein
MRRTSAQHFASAKRFADAKSKAKLTASSTLLTVLL